MWDHAELYIAILGFIVTAILIVGRVTWKLSRVELSLRQTIQASRDEVELRQDTAANQFGETIRGLQEHIRTSEASFLDKIREVELYCRDTFVRRDGFYKVRDEMARDLQSFGDKIEARLERMEAKIDAKIAHQ